MSGDGEGSEPLEDSHALATVELLGSLAYGQLRSFAATAQTIPLAPDTAVADALVAWADEELHRYQRLRDHLDDRTQLVTAVMERQRGYFDDFFDRAPLQDWFGTCVFFALGLPIAADFIRAVAPALDDESAAVVRATLERQELQDAALEELRRQLVDDAARERARQLTADLLGRALTGFQGVMANTDALKVLLAADLHEGETGEQRVKRLALEVLEGHRRRVVELGLEDLDDVT